MEKESRKEKKKIDGNAIVAPQNTRRLYGRKKLDQDEIVAGQSEDTPTSLPEDIEYIDENLFPSAP